MLSFTLPLLGGVLLGLGGALFLLVLGRIAGVAGIVGRLVAGPRREIAVDAAFIVGLIASGLTFSWVASGTIGPAIETRWPVIVVAGLLVGFGASFGNGCTSGHGVCGIGRGSPRSMLATGVFTLTAMVTVFIIHHVIGATP